MTPVDHRRKRGKRGMDINQVTERIIGAAIRVHTQLGPGLLELIYEKCLAIELAKAGLRFERQFPVPIIYDGIHVGHGLYIDLFVERLVVVEVKTVDKFHPVHTAQILSYMKLTDSTVGLLLNFHAYRLPDGIKRIVRNYDGDIPRFPRFPRS
jgi:GxxExxY protein